MIYDHRMGIIGRKKPQEDSVGFIGLIKSYANFRRLYAARTISLLGDWFNLLALIALLRELTDSTAATFSWLFIAKLVPNFFAGPLAGVCADRFNRKTIMILSDLARFILACVYFLVPFFPSQAVGLVLGLALLQNAASAFFEPARAAILPNLIPENLLVTANTLGALTWSAMYALGAALGGVFTYFFGWRVALILDASTFLVSAWFVSRIVASGMPRTKSVIHRWDVLGLGDMVRGFTFVKGQPKVVYTMLIKSGWCIAGSISLVLALFGEKIHHLGGRPDLGTASLFVARALGSGIGPLMAKKWSENDLERMRKAILIGFLLGGLFYFAFGLAENAMLAWIFVFTAHLGGSTVWVFSTVILQRLVPDEYRGRVFAAELGLATLMISVSTYIFGQAAEGGLTIIRGLPFVLGGLLICSTIIFGIWARSPRQR